MSATLPQPVPATLLPSLMRITADQYHILLNDGGIPDGASYELLDGFIVHKDRARLGGDPMGQDPLHVAEINLLTDFAARVKNEGRYLQIQAPIALTALYEPEPDGAIIRGAWQKFLKSLPEPEDVLCVFEASHSSLARDQETKLAAYARAGIRQYVIINLQSAFVQIHTQPDKVAATYRTKTTFNPGESFLIDLPGESISVAVNEILPL